MADYTLGNGWGWFINIDYIDLKSQTKPIKIENRHIASHVYKRSRMSSIKSMESTRNLLDLYEADMQNEDNNYSMWGINITCILSVIAFGFIVL